MNYLRKKLKLISEIEKLWLYNLGDECTDITGGWKDGGYTRGSGYQFTKYDNYLYLYSNATANCTRSVSTVKPIDISGYSTINFIVDSTANTLSRNNAIRVCQKFLWGDSPAYSFRKWVTVELRELGSVSQYSISFNADEVINELGTSQIYPVILCDTWNSANIKDGYIKLYKCWLER